MIKAGIPTIEEYGILTSSPVFRQMEEFSDSFVKTNSVQLADYSRRWVEDPFHQFNRQWEYPFVYDRISAHASLLEEGPVRILDAGSGVTFFPYFLASRVAGSVVSCCDCDSSLGEVFAQINRRAERAVEFGVEDIHNLSYRDGCFDIAYCISVLEHTKEYEGIIEEFRRVLVPGGMLVVTFDICLDGSADIPPGEAEKILSAIASRFAPHDPLDGPLPEMLRSPGLVTSNYIRSVAPDLLPWKHPVLTAFRSLARLRLPSLARNVTFFGQAFTKV